MPLADKIPLAVNKPHGCHSIFCWSVKVCCGTILIASLFICTLYELQPWFVPPRLLAQTLVIIGGLSAVFHYRKLDSFSCRFAQPDTLVTDQGLYRYIRHPMYLSDCLICTGLFLLFPTVPTAMILAAGIVALVRQSKEEDRYLSERFKQQFTDWRTHTKLIVPLVY
jgi:protein-S-isoprenylcysteine O-methyltransferase Ste14